MEIKSCFRWKFVEKTPHYVRLPAKSLAMLSEDLKQNTEDIHKSAEKVMIGWLKRIRTKADHVAFLGWLYAYYSPVESLIRQQLTPDRFPDMDRRSRAENLLRDMEQTGLPAPPPQRCEELPVIDSFGKALGALYVLEGSTLGGRIIAAMLARTLGDDKSLSYFNSYGNETGGMWTSFRDFLDSDATASIHEEIVQSAQATFLTFKNWIEKHELQPQL